MKPSIERELEAIRQQLRDLETRLKNENVQLGYRPIFQIGKRGDVPAPTSADRGRVLGVDGWFTVTGSGGGGLSTVYVDNLTIGGDGSATYPLSASLLSGTINARFQSLYSVFLQSVTHDSTLTGDGTAGTPLSASPLSGTIRSAFLNMFSGSQRFTYNATGGEGNSAQVTLPRYFGDEQYSVFLTKISGTGVGSYSVPRAYQTSASFYIYSTQPFQSTDKIDVLAISSSLGLIGDTSSFANISGSFAASVVTGLANLSGTINSAIVALSGTVARRDIDLSGSVDGHFNQLSGTINARFTTVSGAPSIWDVPSSPHADDDEFLTASTSSWTMSEGLVGGNAIDPYSGFTTGDSRVESHTRRPSWLMVQVVNAGSQSNLHFTKTHTYPTDQFVWMRASFNHRVSSSPNDHTVGLFITPATYGLTDCVFVYLNVTNTTMVAEFRKIVGGASTSIGSSQDNPEADHTAFEAVGIQKIGTTYHAWVFTANGSALHLGSTTHATTFGRIGIRFLNSSNASPGNAIMGADFVRFKDSAVWLP